jgi:hypothetical protein
MNNFTLRYLDHLPHPDKELCYTHLNTDVQRNGLQHLTSAQYHRHSFNEQLLEWVKNNISEKFIVSGSGVSKVSNGSYHRIHNDSSRTYVLSYIFETGGSNVITSFYKEKSHSLLREPGTYIDDMNTVEVIDQFKIDPNRWHLINSQILHGVHGLVSPRISIQVGLHDIFDIT